MTPAVLCLRPRADFERADALPPASLDVTYRGPADPDVTTLIRASRALLVPAVGPPLAAALFDGASLDLVQVTGAGVDRLDRAALERLHIRVANVPGGSNRAVAEYAVTSASMLLRQLAWSDAEIRAGHYVAFRARMIATNLSGLGGLLVGVVGLGTIGLAVATMFHDLGCRIAFYDPSPANPAAAAAIGAVSMSLDGLLAASDIVSLHVPLLPATKNLIGDRQLALMKPGAVLIQASRGGVVDEAALAAHLRAGHLGGVAVDVYATEPPPRDHPLLTLDGDAARRVVLTPHIAGVTRQSATFLFRAAWRNVERVLVEGGEPENRVY